MNKEKYFLNLMTDLCKKLKVKAPHVMYRDNRMGQYVAGVIECRYGYEFKYNTKRINQLSKFEMLLVILHEIGHMKKSKTLIAQEYEAEVFAVDTIKKFYPKQYVKTIKFLYRYYTKHHNRTYRESFGKLAIERLKELNRGK